MLSLPLLLLLSGRQHAVRKRTPTQALARSLPAGQRMRVSATTVAHTARATYPYAVTLSRAHSLSRATACQCCCYSQLYSLLPAKHRAQLLHSSHQCNEQCSLRACALVLTHTCVGLVGELVYRCHSSLPLLSSLPLPPLLNDNDDSDCRYVPSQFPTLNSVRRRLFNVAHTLSPRCAAVLISQDRQTHTHTLDSRELQLESVCVFEC